MSYRPPRAPAHRPYPVRRFSPYPPRGAFVPRAPPAQRPAQGNAAPLRGAVPRKDTRHPYLELSGFFNKFPFGQVDRRLVDIAKRHPRRQLPSDLWKMNSLWSAMTKEELSIPVNAHVEFRIDPKNAIMDADKPVCQPEQQENVAIRHFVRVMLFSGAKDEDPKKIKWHLSRRLTFLVLKREQQGPTVGGVFPIGAEWCRELDGEEPSAESFRNTAVRATLSAIGVDLTDCKQWTTFAEFHYNRGENEKSHTVILIPHIWASHPEGISPHSVVRESQIDVTEEIEDVSEDGQKVRSRAVVKKSVRTVLFRPHEITLYQLLEEVRVPSNAEDSAELVLFADLFDELLQRDFGLEVLRIFQARQAEAETDRKRKRAPEDFEAKRQRTQEEGNEVNKPAEGKSVEVKIVQIVDTQILTAFQYFDRPTTGALVGNIKREKLAGLLHCLGDLTAHQVTELLTAVNLRTPTKPGTQVPPLYYMKLATVTQEVPVEEQKEQRPTEEAVAPAESVVEENFQDAEAGEWPNIAGHDL